MFRKFNPHPAVAKPVGQPSVAKDMPAQVAAQIDSMGALAQSAPEPTAAEPVKPKSPELEKAINAARPGQTFTPARAAAGVAIVAILAGFVWLQNSPKLAFHDAAAKAGIEASLPTYVPSSYRQAGPVEAGNGQVSLHFTTPGSDEKLNIVQKKTDWDPDSLRENYVAKQSDNFLAVQGQGLTIYVFNNQANWVNHGIWYSISGTSKLSREQVLKIAYGL
ncbi:MAG TPA: hypothetical protein VLF21_00640 [Candidatus Saccharimonadales bacterium]|nr:hypothetical protein [Candidatus Saccharimonadales bacterium]